MPQALITQAGTKFDNTAFSGAGSQLDAKINSVVNLANLNSGGELTYTWAILDQPPGATDALSSVSSPSPFFTPKKEGSYLIRLIVNQSLVTEQEDRVVLAVAQLKTRERVPAAGETTEADPSDGWATSSNSMLRRVDFLLSDPGILVGVNASGGTLTRGQIVRAPNTDVIKATLPGAETVPGFTTVSAATLSTIDELLCIVEGTPSGLPGVPGVGTAEQRMMKVRYIGRIAALPIANGPISPGEVVFVNDAGALDRLQGTIRRRVGSVQGPAPSSTMDVWFNGVGGADIDLPSITEPYVTNGPSALPNAFRIDGANAGARTAAMGPFEVHTGDAATPTTRWRRFSAGGASIGEWTTEAGTALVRVSATGQLVIEVGAGGLFVNAGGISVTAGGISVASGGGNITFGAASQKLAWPNFKLQELSSTTFEFLNGATSFFGLVFSSGAFAQHSLTSGAVFFDFRASTTTSSAFISVSSNHPLDFFTNAIVRWRINATGELVAQGANRAIQSVLDPVTAQDAVTKVYADSLLVGGNLIINGNFDFWQRGAVINTLAGSNKTVTHSAAANVFNRQYGADRWYCDVSDVLIAGSGNTANVTRQASGLTTSPFCARLRSVGVVSANGSYSLTQEIDRDLINAIRGKTLTVQFKIRADATYIANGGNTQIRITSGTDAGGNVVRRNYAGATAVLSFQIISNASLTGAFQTFTYTGGTPVPSNCTELAFNISCGGTGTYDHYIEVAEVMIVPETSSVPEFFVRHGGTFINEFHACMRFCETTYEFGVAPGTAVNPDKDSPWTAFWPSQIGTVFGNPIPIGLQPRYRVEKWDSSLDGIDVTFYRSDTANTVGSWLITGAFVQPVTAIGGSGTNSFIIFADSTIGAIGAVTDLRRIFGHWLSSGDIGDAA